MPGEAVLSAAPDVGHGQNSAQVSHEQQVGHTGSEPESQLRPGSRYRHVQIAEKKETFEPDRPLVQNRVATQSGPVLVQNPFGTGRCGSLVVRLDGVLEAAIAVQEDRVGSVPLQVPGVDQEHGNAGSVLTGVENLGETHGSEPTRLWWVIGD